MTNISWSKKCVFFPAGLFVSVSQDKPVTKIIKTFQVADFDNVQKQNILDHLEMVQTIWKVSRQSGQWTSHILTIFQTKIRLWLQSPAGLSESSGACRCISTTPGYSPLRPQCWHSSTRAFAPALPSLGPDIIHIELQPNLWHFIIFCISFAFG